MKKRYFVIRDCVGEERREVGCVIDFVYGDGDCGCVL